MLVLETYADNVYVESPPSELPRQLDANFRRAKIPASKSDCQRQIFLRPRDTVVFDNEACAILVSVGISPDSSDNRPVAAADDIQVKSSAQQSTDAGGGAHPDAVMKDDETEDEDDLDAPMANTPDGVDPNTPATSRSTDGPAVKETPSKRPGSHESNHMFSTAPDNLDPNQDANDANNTPSDRTRIAKRKATAQQPDGDDSQHVFQHKAKKQATYGKKSNQATPVKASPKQSGKKETSPRPSPKRADPSDDKPYRLAEIKRTMAEESEHLDKTVFEPARKRDRECRHEEAQAAKADLEKTSSAGRLKGVKRKSDVNESEQGGGKASRATRREKELCANHHHSLTPPSSGPPLPNNTPNKILLSKSKFADDSKAKGWLKKHGVTVTEDVPGKRTNFICVIGVGVLTATAKVVRSLALGKRIVTDQWLEESMSQDQLLGPNEYIHDDLVDTADVNRSKLFAGKTVYFTPALKNHYGSEFAEVERLLGEAGASKVESGPVKKASGMPASSTIFLGLEGLDQDAEKLVKEDKKEVFIRGFVPQSIIRGKLLDDYEAYRWKFTTAAAKKGKKK